MASDGAKGGAAAGAPAAAAPSLIETDARVAWIHKRVHTAYHSITKADKFKKGFLSEESVCVAARASQEGRAGVTRCWLATARRDPRGPRRRARASLRG